MASSGPPWAAAATRAEKWCPALRSGPKSSRRINPGFLPCLTGFPELHWSQGRSHAGVKGHDDDSAPLNARESLRAQGAWLESSFGQDSWGGMGSEVTPLVAPPTVYHVIRGSLWTVFGLLPLAHVRPRGHVGAGVGCFPLLRCSGLPLASRSVP